MTMTLDYDQKREILEISPRLEDIMIAISKVTVENSQFAMLRTLFALFYRDQIQVIWLRAVKSITGQFTLAPKSHHVPLQLVTYHQYNYF